MSNVPTATGAGGQDRFNTLMVRLEFLVHWLKLAAEDLSDMPTTEEHTSAAFVVQEATQDLAQLLEAFGTFDGEYDYTPRDPQVMGHLRRLAESERTTKGSHGSQEQAENPKVVPSSR